MPSVVAPEQPPPPGAISLRHPYRGFWMDIVDEGSHDAALLRVRAQISARKRLGERDVFDTTLWLRLWPTDDGIEVRTTTGEPVGSFSRREASRYLPMVRSLAAAYGEIWCRACVYGGYVKSAPWNVLLDVPAPTDYARQMRADGKGIGADAAETIPAIRRS